MSDEQIARIQLLEALNNVQSIMHELTIGELDELIDEVTVLYERFNNDINMRKGGQPE